jgi:hypothetical protein
MTKSIGMKSSIKPVATRVLPLQRKGIGTINPEKEAIKK